MHSYTAVATGARHQVYAALRRARGRRGGGDRGAVSLEQVLWFVAAGVSVAIIAAILWNRIRDEANEPIETPDPLG